MPIDMDWVRAQMDAAPEDYSDLERELFAELVDAQAEGRSLTQSRQAWQDTADTATRLLREAESAFHAEARAAREYETVDVPTLIRERDEARADVAMYEEWSNSLSALLGDEWCGDGDEGQEQLLTWGVQRLLTIVARVEAQCDPASGMATNCWPGARHLDAADVLRALRGTDG